MSLRHGTVAPAILLADKFNVTKNKRYRFYVLDGRYGKRGCLLSVNRQCRLCQLTLNTISNLLVTTVQ